jgi:hypothetical protein
MDRRKDVLGQHRLLGIHQGDMVAAREDDHQLQVGEDIDPLAMSARVTDSPPLQPNTLPGSAATKLSAIARRIPRARTDFLFTARLLEFELEPEDGHQGQVRSSHHLLGDRVLFIQEPR